MVIVLKILFLLVQVFIWETSGKPKPQSCESYSWKNYSCVPLHECSFQQCIVTGDTDVKKIEIRTSLMSSVEENDCIDVEQDEIYTSSCPDVRGISEEQPVCCHKKYIKHEDEGPEPLPPPPYACGRRNGKIDQRITFPMESGESEWPHMCAIFKTSGENNKTSFLAGGSLIAPGIILTAGHRTFDIKSENQLIVRCQIISIDPSKKDNSFQQSSVRKITVHPGFDESSLRSDFALLHLSKDFEMSIDLGPICLPKYNPNDEILDTEACMATGWGKQSKGDGSRLSDTLKYVELPIVNRTYCTEITKQIKGKDFIIDKSFICAGGKKNFDTCEGDGGGPLFCRRIPDGDNGESYVQVGIVAWGIGCGANIPAFYASVQQGLCFIDWATKCINGNKYKNYYDYKECADWAEDQKNEYELKKTKLAFALSSPKSNNQIHLNYIEKELQKTEYSLKKLDQLLEMCEINDSESSLSDIVNIRKNSILPSPDVDTHKDEEGEVSEEDEDDAAERSIFSDLKND